MAQNAKTMSADIVNADIAALVPALPRGVRLRFDESRQQWFLLGPERVFEPDAIAVAVLQLCDGVRSVEVIAAELANTYNAPRERILADIVTMLQGLADKGVVVA